MKKIFLSILCLSSILYASEPKKKGYTPKHVRRRQKKGRQQAKKEQELCAQLAAQEAELLSYCEHPCSQADLEQIELLLKKSVSPNMPNAIKKRVQGLPLGIAAGCGHAGLTELLLHYGADVHTIDSCIYEQDTSKTINGYPLHSAAHARLKHSQDDGVGKYANVIEQLVQAGAQVNVGGTDDLPYAPLHIAAMQQGIPWRRKRAVMNALVKNGAQVNKKSNTGKTALSLSVKIGDEDAVKWLLSKEADPTIRDNEGNKPSTIKTQPNIEDLIHIAEQKKMSLKTKSEPQFYHQSPPIQPRRRKKRGKKFLSASTGSIYIYW